MNAQTQLSHISCDQGEGQKPLLVECKTFTVPGIDHVFALHAGVGVRQGQWSVTEPETGRHVTSAPTPEAAQEDATALLLKAGNEALKKSIADLKTQST